MINMRKLFRDLSNRIDNPLDSGMAEGHISLAGKAAFDARKKDVPDDSYFAARNCVGEAPNLCLITLLKCWRSG
jgi:hypothetical protein